MIKEGETVKEKPVDDGYYIHLFDTLRYVATNYFEVTGKKPEPNPITHSQGLVTYREEIETPNKNIIPEDEGIKEIF